MTRPAAALVLLAVCVSTACGRGSESEDERAARIHRDALVLDTHADTTPRFQDPAFDFSARHAAGEVQIDLPRAREGGLDVQFWSI